MEAGNDFSDIQDILEEIRAATAEIAEITRETEAGAAKERAEAAEGRDDLEKERRAGEHGRDWQQLQQRIDIGRTTESDILSGVDHSDEARAVRSQLGKSLSEGRVIFQDVAESQESEFEQMREAQRELARTMAELDEINRNL